MSFSAEQAACQVQERLKSITKLVHDIEKERNRSEHTLNNITKTHDKIIQEGKISMYYQQKLKSLCTTAVSDAEQEEDLLRKTLAKIYEIRNICNERRIQMRCANNKETVHRSEHVKMLKGSALTLPLWVGKPGEKPPPLCGAIPAESNYIAKMGDMVAAYVKNSKNEENWILAEVVSFNQRSNSYEVIDIDEHKERHTVSRSIVVPLPLMRANPETDRNALFPERAQVLALYPSSTCLYNAIVNKLPQTATDDYEVLFKDEDYEGGYSPPLEVEQAYMIAAKNRTNLN